MNLYANLKTGVKLAVGFGLIIALVGALAAYAVMTASRIDANYSYLIDYPQSRYDALMDITNNYNRHAAGPVAYERFFR